MTLKKAKEVIFVEAQAILALGKKLDKSFIRAVDLIESCAGRVIVTGMGKSGIIGRKIAATFSSTGTPSIFMHCADAVHGDLGQVKKDDILMVISYSGETEETTQVVPLVKKIGCKTIAMTGRKHSKLAQHSDVSLNISVKMEGCPLGLAPMASTTAALVMGDALAACLIERRGFKKEDFAFYHPAGTLGRRLLLKVEDIMRNGKTFPRVTGDTPVRKVLLAITQKRCGSACVVDQKGKLIGIFTDGDLRRHLNGDREILDRQVKTVMTRDPLNIRAGHLAVEAFAQLQDKKVDELPVVDDQGKAVGLLDIQDLLKARLF